jgi:ribose transport system ATP-binding protein
MSSVHTQAEVLGDSVPQASLTGIQVNGLHKSLAGIPVLRGIDMTVRPGEVHALLGGNGAGKSTLIKCLSGYWIPDSGTITVVGVPLNPLARQIAFVQQDLGLIPSLTVSENISLGAGFDTGLFGNIRWAKQAEEAGRALEDLGHGDIDPRAEVRTLNPVQKTAVAIARASLSLRDGAKFLVLDEPTASLPVAEVDRLFETLNRLRKSGVGMIYVSHHLSEVFELSDRISVLRGGSLIATKDTVDFTESGVIELMLGKPLEEVRRQAGSNQVDRSNTVLRLNGLYGPRIRDVSLDIVAGEIVGLAGLQGSGCTELAELIFGAQQRISGEIEFLGKPVSFNHPADAVSAGIAMVTEDRHLNGSFADHSLGENITITDLRRFQKWGHLSHRSEQAEVAELINLFDVRPADGAKRFSAFSGGNQQKGILAKWMRNNPKLLICDQPDIGVDVGARSVIYLALQKAARSGAAVIVISNQYEDLEKLCDRVVVLKSGVIVKELTGEDITEHAISLAAIGSIQEAEGQTP